MAITEDLAQVVIGSVKNGVGDSIVDRIDRRIAEKINQRNTIKSRGIFGFVPSLADFRRLAALDIEIAALKQVRTKAVQLLLQGKDFGPSQLSALIDDNPKLHSIRWLTSIDQSNHTVNLPSRQLNSSCPQEQARSMNIVNGTSRDSLTPAGAFEGLLLVKAIQLAEHEQPLDDVSAMREAHSQYRHSHDRLVRRAVLLAPQVGLDQELAHWREWLIWVCVGSALLVAVLSYGLVSAVVGGDRRINALGALLVVLGPHMVSLTIWVFALVFGSSGGGLPRWVLVASTRIPGFKRQSSRLCLSAGLVVLGQTRGLLGWAFGTMTHAIWVMAFVLTLGGLFTAFSFFSFRLTWETTILSPETLTRIAQIVGLLPQWLGIPTPDVADVLSGAGDHKGWALWLIGCTLVYGLGLRVLAAVISAVMLWRTVGRLHIDTKDPYIRRLIHRFDTLNAIEVLDAEHPQPVKPPMEGYETGFRSGWAVVGFELPENVSWPPVWATGNRMLQKTDGAVVSNRAVLEQLKLVNPHRLLIVCNRDASPDRATERFIREVSKCSDESAVLLVTSSAQNSSLSADRWLDWLQPIGLNKVFNMNSDLAVKWAKEEHGKGN
jgi:hypothetical protein